jgi:pimeloyl-ACP methyl ester carboxylesterase
MTWKLHVERWGQAGPSVLLVHGLGASGRCWRWVAEQLAGEARPFAPDLLGFGHSRWPEIEYRVVATGMTVRLLHGGLDREAPPDTIVELARRTGWTLDPVRGAGHGLPIERPERCADAIRGLVAMA